MRVLSLLLFWIARSFSSILDMPPPVIYKNGPGKCATNMVKCKELMRVDWCIHFCIFIDEGYLNLNVSFSVWAVKSDEIAFELGAIEDDPESQSNPPSISGKWEYAETANDIRRIKITHFRHSDDENPHFFRFKYPITMGDTFTGNILKYDQDKEEFQLLLTNRATDASLQGWMDQTGTKISWDNINVDGDKVTRKEMQFVDQTFNWPARELPRERGCYNYGPLDKQPASAGLMCGPPPGIGQYDGQIFIFTDEENAQLDAQLLSGESACPVCDMKEMLKNYYACSKRFESQKAESQRCQDFADKLMSLPFGGLGDVARWVCTTRLQLCLSFKSVTFTTTNIEVCPIPRVSVITDKDDGSFDKMSDIPFPEANPVIFVCVDFPVTDGLKGQMSERMKARFHKVGKKAKVSPWLIWYQRFKTALFTVGGIMFARFLLRSPTAEERVEYEEFDDAKFFEEYGDFYSDTETESTNENDIYDEMM